MAPSAAREFEFVESPVVIHQSAIEVRAIRFGSFDGIQQGDFPERYNVESVVRPLVTPACDRVVCIYGLRSSFCSDAPCPESSSTTPKRLPDILSRLTPQFVLRKNSIGFLAQRR